MKHIYLCIKITNMCNKNERYFFEVIILKKLFMLCEIMWN